MKKIKSMTYPQMIAAGYLLIIAIGALLLSLPVANRNGLPLAFTDCLFTSVSATCVTGLVVADTYTQWSMFGQLVILSLIQIGGLGFMTIITMFSFLLRRKISLTERGLLRESVNITYIGGVVRLIRKVLLGTLIFEGIGAALLAIRFIPKMGWTEGIYNGIFHSVSAFCNSGFDIMGKYGQYSSLVTFSGDALVCLTIAGLVVIGGIGFFVWDDLSKNRLYFNRYQLQTKIVLTATAVLIATGSILFYVFEKDNLLQGMTAGEQIISSVFGSITPRTAGFNSVSTSGLSSGGKFLTMMLMFIGGSPGSTAGGVKTATIAVVVISLWSSLRNSKSDNVFGRRLEEDTIKRSSAVIAIYTIFTVAAAFLICATNTSFVLSDVLFEVLSAIGTVGLTTGITTSLSTFAQMILALLMYSGRVGSLSFALMFTEHKKPSAIQNPLEKINVG